MPRKKGSYEEDEERIEKKGFVDILPASNAAAMRLASHQLLRMLLGELVTPFVHLRQQSP